MSLQPVKRSRTSTARAAPSIPADLPQAAAWEFLLQDVLLPKKLIHQQDIFTLLMVSPAMASTVTACCAGQLQIILKEHPESQQQQQLVQHQQQQQALPVGVAIGRWFAKFSRLVGSLGFNADFKVAPFVAAGLAAANGVLSSPLTRSQTAAARAFTPEAAAAITTAAGAVTRVGELPLEILVIGGMANGRILSSLAGCSKLCGLDITFTESKLAFPGCLQTIPSLTALMSVKLRQDKPPSPAAQPNRAQQRAAVSRALSPLLSLHNLRRLHTEGIAIPACSIHHLPSSLLYISIGIRDSDGPFQMDTLLSVKALALPYVQAGDMLPPYLMRLTTGKCEVAPLLAAQHLTKLCLAEVPSAAVLLQLQGMPDLQHLEVSVRRSSQGGAAADDLVSTAAPLQLLPLKALCIDDILELPRQFVQEMANFTQVTCLELGSVTPTTRFALVAEQLLPWDQLTVVHPTEKATIKDGGLVIHVAQADIPDYAGPYVQMAGLAGAEAGRAAEALWLRSWELTIQRLAQVPSLRQLTGAWGWSIGSTALEVTKLTQLTSLTLLNVSQDVQSQLAAKRGHLQSLKFE